MRAIVASGTKPMLVERARPVTGADEAVIAVRLAGLCRSDIYAARGQIPVASGTVLGHEFCGVIESVGDNVSHLVPGQRVGVMPVYPQGDGFVSLGIIRDGAFAEAVAVPAAHVYPVPEGLSDRRAAYLEPVAASLAVLAAPIDPAMRGAIYGNNRIAELTARILVGFGFPPPERLSEATPSSHPGSYDYIIETLANEASFARIIAWLRPGGLLIVKSRPYTAIPVSVTAIVQKQLRLIGVHYGDFNEAIDVLVEDRIEVDDLLGESFSLEEAVAILSGERPVAEDKKIFFAP